MVVDISPWEITYTVDTGSIPLDDDYAALTEATSDYLDGYFASYFEIIGNIDFISSTTVKISDQFVLNQPIIVGFSAIALFSETSQTIPSTTDMNSLLAQAFAGDGYTAYLSVVQSLSNTLFSTTSEFSFTQAAQSSEQESTTAKTAGIAAAAAAGAFAIVMGVLMFHRRRATQDEDDFYNPQKVHDGDGHMTVAGETIGETIAGTMSLESRSLYNTEDGVPEGADSWEGYQQHYSTAAYRTDSPIDDELGHDSDESERSDDSDASPRYMENVAL